MKQTFFIARTSQVVQKNWASPSTKHTSIRMYKDSYTYGHNYTFSRCVRMQITKYTQSQNRSIASAAFYNNKYTIIYVVSNRRCVLHQAKETEHTIVTRTKLCTNNIGITFTESITTDSAPGSVDTYLQTTLQLMCPFYQSQITSSARITYGRRYCNRSIVIKLQVLFPSHPGKLHPHLCLCTYLWTHWRVHTRTKSSLIDHSSLSRE